jgi:hypothetical protein
MNLRKAIRQAANCVGTNIPILVIKGDYSPICKGTGYHYRNKSGDLIHSPNAYRRAWGKPIYYPSSIRIEVGEEWPMHVGLTSCVVKKV